MALFPPQRASKQALKRPSIVSDFALSIWTLSARCLYWLCVPLENNAFSTRAIVVPLALSHSLLCRAHPVVQRASLAPET